MIQSLREKSGSALTSTDWSPAFQMSVARLTIPLAGKKAGHETAARRQHKGVVAVLAAVFAFTIAAATVFSTGYLCDLMVQRLRTIRQAGSPQVAYSDVWKHAGRP